MAMRYYISTEEASFFINNRMGYANSIPTSGNYKVGDFIISSTQEDGIFGWVCTVAGTPGEWEVIGSGMGNSGSVMHDKVVGYINAVSFSDARSSIEIGINEYVKGKDFLEVHYNGLMLAEGVHYNVSEDGKSIIALDEVWNENADDTQQMIFRVIKSEGVNVKELKNTINIDSACYEVEMGIEGYSPERDVVEVHLNGVLLVQGVDYEIVEGRISKLDRSEAWNPYNVSGQKMFVRLFRNIANLIEPSDGSVTMEKLSPDVRSDVAAIDGLVSSMSIQNSTISNLNDRVTAIEEKIESGDIVTNGGGGGGPVKLTYKDNLVEVINTNTVVIGLPFNKEKDMLEVHIDGLKLAEGVHYNISEDGKSIVKVEGVWNPDSLEDQYIDFRVITAGNQQIDHLTRNVEFSSPMTEVGIELEYEHGVDILIVHLNGIKLVEGLDFEYVAEGNKIVKIDVSEPWNLYGVDGQLFVIDVLSNVGEKVTMNDLADDVKQAIESAGNIDITGKQDATDNNLATTDKTIVGAINELFQSANNGKELIASAIGEPLNAEDTFSAMSTGINGLLSTFKTNMMNNGVMVESADKFKQLIDKIATLADNEGKGIQYATGSVDMTKTTIYSPGFNGVSNPKSTTITTNLNFVPTMIFVELPLGIYCSDSDATTSQYNGMILNNIVSTGVYYTWMTMVTINNITANSFDIYAYIPGDRTTDELYIPASTITWYAIGVGEEDTTLRDSLADILENKGVDVTEEDDMASLITKVDSISGGLDIISATELPNEVVNNRIVLITANTPTDINVKDSSLCNPTTNGEMNVGVVTVPDDSGVPYNITQNNIMLSLYLKVAKERVNNVVSTLNGYAGIGGQWVQFSKATFLVYDNGQDNYGISTSSNWSLAYATFSLGTSNFTIYINGHGDNAWQDAAGWFNKKFDLTNYSTLKITGTKNSSATFGFSTSIGTTASMSKSFSLGTSSSEITVDISSLTGEYYLLVKGRSTTTKYAAASISRFELIP